MSSELAVAVVCGMVASLAYALSNVLQQHEAEQMVDDDTLGIGLLTKLAHRPRWLVGIGADVAGYVFEALALGAGALVLVEPILATSLVFSLLFGAMLHGRHVSSSGWVAAILLAASVSFFLVQVSPSGGASVAPVRRWLLAGPPVAAFVFVCVGAAATQTGPRRAALLSAGAGVAFGVSAVLTKGFVHYLGDGPTAWIPHWEPYGLAVSSIGGLVLAQSAFQTGALAAAVGAEQVMQPLAGVALGVGILGEQVSAADPLSRVLAALALSTMLLSVAVVARVEHPEPAGAALDGGAHQSA
ncbi:MAG: DMT family transporter [Actinomycetota bacterium]|nr:DMT family transporter [Actinomycetota bacterium]